jgi:hypothetical protein
LPPLPDTPDQLSTWLAALTVAGWLAAFLGFSLLVLNRRDV